MFFLVFEVKIAYQKKGEGIKELLSLLKTKGFAQVSRFRI